MTMTDPAEVGGQPAPFCALCGHPMQSDQEWCLQCGSARTVIARPPDWRVPVLIIGAVVLLIAGGAFYAISQLAGRAGTVTVINTTTSKPTSAVAAWAPGLDGYTVVLAAASSQATATGEATGLLAKRFADVGVLDVHEHPQMKFKGPWMVFSGRYPTYSDAKFAAARAAKRGQFAAKPALVQLPGQG
jgi:hypothetical protein